MCQEKMAILLQVMAVVVESYSLGFILEGGERSSQWVRAID
jgi:hypothetical protein